MDGVIVTAEAKLLNTEVKNVIVSTTYLDMSRVTSVTGGYDFGYNVFQAVKNATLVVILNNGTVQAAPCIITKRASGTYVVTYSSTSFYVTAANPTVLATSDPD